MSASPFCHIVIPAPDLAKAKSFYEAVFGWTVQQNEPAPKYWFFKSGNVGGAFTGHQAPAKSVVLLLEVDDMPAALGQITAHGGTITRERSAIGEGDEERGYDAYFLDPNGNEMGIYSDK